jgi:hypothetical protein
MRWCCTQIFVPRAAVLYHPADAGARRYHPGQESRQTRRNSSFPV